MSVVGAGLAAIATARSVSRDASTPSESWQRGPAPCKDLGAFATTAQGGRMRCTGLAYRGSEDPARLPMTGVVVRTDDHTRIDARVTYSARDGGQEVAHTTDFRLLVLEIEEGGPSKVSVSFTPGGGPDDPFGGGELQADAERDDGSRTYGACHRAYADASSNVLQARAGEDVELDVPTSANERATIHRFRTFGLIEGEADLDLAFLTHDPKIVLRAKSGDETKHSPLEGEPTARGHIECCADMPLKDECSCDPRGLINHKSLARGTHEDDCELKSQCIYNWDHNKGQFGCP